MALLNRPGRYSPQLIVRSLSRNSTVGRLTFGLVTVACALGRSGKTFRKREGDGATPIGSFALRKVFYRPDRLRAFATGISTARLAPHDGWCDAPHHRLYNRFVRHPISASAEHLWRDDHLYDLIVVIGHNDRPRMKGAGSAIFLHVAREGYEPTEGCVAVRVGDLRKLLTRISPSTRVCIL